MTQNITFIPINNTRKSRKMPVTNITDFQSPVIFMCNGIGDGLLALPAIRALSMLFEDKLTIVYDSVVTPYWLYQLPIKKLILIESSRDKNDLIFDYRSTLEEINNCDLFISLIFVYSKFLIEFFDKFKPKKTIGFHQSFDVYIEQCNMQHISDVYFKIPKLFSPCLNIKDYQYPLDNLHTASIIADRIVTHIKPTDGMKFIIGIHADTQPEKMWSEESWLKLFKLIRLKYSAAVFFIFGMSLAFEIESDESYDFTRLPFEISLALMSRCDFFIGIDSCLLHAADLLDITGVGLFFSTDPVIWGYRFASRFVNIRQTSSEPITPETVFQFLTQWR